MNKGVNAGMFFALFGLFIVGFVTLNIFVRGMFPIIIGMIVFFFVLFFIMGLMRAIASGALEDKMKHKTMCQSCNAMIHIDAQFCPKCGVSQAEGIICEYCGTNNPHDASICENCNGLLK